MKKVSLIALIILAILLIAFFLFKKENKEEYQEPAIKKDKAVEILNSLSFEQKVGQIFMIGFDGTEVTKEVEETIKTLHPGAILLLGKNIENEEQLKKLTDDLQKISTKNTGLPLLIAVDQEGGPVSMIDWVEKTPQLKIKTKEMDIEKYVSFTGYKTGEEKYDIFKKSHLFILPSYTEGFPNVVLEAMMHSRPVVASSLGSLKELVVPGRTGYLCQPKDTEGFKKSLLKLFRDSSLCRKMGRNAYNTVSDKYSPERHYKMLIKVMQKAKEDKKWKH